MLCQECNQKQATVHLTRIINNQKTELYLCEDCARGKKELGLSGEPFSFHNLLAGILNPKTEGEVMGYPYAREQICSGCGLDFGEFSQQGLFGCSTCYDQFSQQMDQLLRRIHGNNRHTGKIPLRSGRLIKQKQKIKDLRHRLQEAVEKEAFEEAAVLRDKIKDLGKMVME